MHPISMLAEKRGIPLLLATRRPQLVENSMAKMIAFL